MTREPPFDRWPVQFEHPAFGYAWYCKGAIIVSHVTITHGTVDSANAYHDFEGQMLRDHADEVAKQKGIFVIHDWRNVVTHDSNARRVWQERMEENPKGYLRGSVVCLSRATALLRMAVQAANLVASVTHGAKVAISTDLPATLAEYGVTSDRVWRGRTQ